MDGAVNPKATHTNKNKQRSVLIYQKNRLKYSIQPSECRRRGWRGKKQKTDGTNS